MNVKAEIISHRMASLDFTPLFCGDFQSFELERTWWRLFQKRVVRTKVDIYDFITSDYDINI